MCQLNAFIARGDAEEKLLETVEIIEADGEKVRLVSMFGEEKKINAKFRYYSNSDGKIVFEPS